MKKISDKILVVDDNEDILQAARLLLKQNGYNVRTESNPENIPKILNEENFELILLDMNFTEDVSGGQEGIHWLGRILEIDPLAVVIIITAYGDVELAVRAIKNGAMDFVQKPWQNEKLIATISAGIKLRKSKDEISNLKSREQLITEDINQKFKTIIGQSESMMQLFSMISKVAATSANVLILGENGTGKELVAREIHRHSERADNLFMAVDMGAISESLFESELFGHVKGAFTDARENRAGRFETASDGTLFLDEIGNINLPLQAKLLTAIQNRKITLVGSNKEIDIDIRLICATNMPIYDMINENRFRQDLLYRVNTVEIKLPPLRERTDDIPVLVDHFLEDYCNKYNLPVKKISKSTMNRLSQYNWPGNIRELRHAIERAVIMSDSAQLGPSDFFFSDRQRGKKELSFDSYNLDEIEEQVIREVIARHGGNISHAAKELGITRTSLYRRVQKYGL